MARPGVWYPGPVCPSAPGTSSMTHRSLADTVAIEDADAPPAPSAPSVEPPPTLAGRSAGELERAQARMDHGAALGGAETGPADGPGGGKSKSLSRNQGGAAAVPHMNSFIMTSSLNSMCRDALSPQP